jgi:hypothetical protein
MTTKKTTAKTAKKKEALTMFEKHDFKSAGSKELELFYDSLAERIGLLKAMENMTEGASKKNMQIATQEAQNICNMFVLKFAKK